MTKFLFQFYDESRQMLRRNHANSRTFCHKVEDFQQTLRTSKCDWPWVLFKNVESRSPAIFQVQYGTECPHKSWELVSSDWFLAWSTNSSSSTGDVWNLLNQLFARIEGNWLFQLGKGFYIINYLLEPDSLYTARGLFIRRTCDITKQMSYELYTCLSALLISNLQDIISYDVAISNSKQWQHGMHLLEYAQAMQLETMIVRSLTQHKCWIWWSSWLFWKLHCLLKLLWAGSCDEHGLSHGSKENSKNLRIIELAQVTSQNFRCMSIDLAHDKATTPASASPKKLLRGWEHLRWWPPFTGTLERLQQTMVNMSCYILSHTILWLSLCSGAYRVPEITIKKGNMTWLKTQIKKHSKWGKLENH